MSPLTQSLDFEHFSIVCSRDFRCDTSAGIGGLWPINYGVGIPVEVCMTVYMYAYAYVSLMYIFRTIFISLAFFVVT